LLFFLITFLSPGIATSINMHVLFSLSRIIMSGLLLGIVIIVIIIISNTCVNYVEKKYRVKTDCTCGLKV